jgi:hypothetical protein
MGDVAASVDSAGGMKSKERAVQHGEVFTPSWVVELMLDLVKDESERIDSRFLEPACGSGNFLVPVLRRKLATVHSRYAKSDFERRHFALFSVMCIYGIELLEDNVNECRENLAEVFAEYLGIPRTDTWYQAVLNVLAANIVHGDALSLTTREASPQPIAFPEWSYLGRGAYQRRDFRYDTLVKMSSFSVEDTLFADSGEHEIFVPTTDHGTLSVMEIATIGAPE